MRFAKIAGLAVATAALSGALIAPGAAQAEGIPCAPAGGVDNNASGICYGEVGQWRVVADCLDYSNIKWPVNRGSVASPWVSGRGEQFVHCAAGLRAVPRIEIR
jgi:hypothetical protein